MQWYNTRIHSHFYRLWKIILNKVDDFNNNGLLLISNLAERKLIFGQQTQEIIDLGIHSKLNMKYFIDE